MNQQMMPTLLELLIHFFLWSSALALIAYGITLVCKKLRHWSALWKTTLLLCFLPLFPWSYFEWFTFDLYYVNHTLLELPTEWIRGLAINSEELNYFNRSEFESSSSPLLEMFLLLIATVSLTRIVSYLVKLKNFKRTLQSFNRKNLNSSSLTFLAEKQRVFIEKRAIDILVVEELISPYVTGLFRPKLVLPESFFSLPTTQQVLLFEHELTHIKHHDVAWLNVSQVLSSLLWFAPAIRFFQHQIEQSIEIECDTRVLEKYPTMKKEYGGALINIIKLTQQKVQPQAAFFISQQFGTLKNRILLTQQKNKTQGINLMHKITLGLSAILLSSASWALSAKMENLMKIEEFLSIHKHATRHIDEVTKVKKPTGTWTNPLVTSRVSSKFKAKQRIRGFKAHLGIDLAAEKGQPIVAASQGIVVIADDSTLHKNYGKVVVIDHGEGTLSMYLHMDSIAVNKGDAITLGQSIGEVGDTGKATGPHLHFEVITAGRHIDPASIIEFSL
jgi:murein DD-endopeptidase MepM/ murein hydrolase activator NlpD